MKVLLLLDAQEYADLLAKFMVSILESYVICSRKSLDLL